jgi:hypothetical protein
LAKENIMAAEGSRGERLEKTTPARKKDRTAAARGRKKAPRRAVTPEGAVPEPEPAPAPRGFLESDSVEVDDASDSDIERC